jgi:hypothetical protein
LTITGNTNALVTVICVRCTLRTQISRPICAFTHCRASTTMEQRSRAATTYGQENGITGATVAPRLEAVRIYSVRVLLLFFFFFFVCLFVCDHDVRAGKWCYGGHGCAANGSGAY